MEKLTYMLFLVVGIVLGIFLLQTGELVISGFASVSGETNVTNYPPEIATPEVDDDVSDPAGEIDLNAGNTKAVTCTTQVYDENLPSDSLSVSAVLFNSDETTYDDDEDYNLLYTDADCTIEDTLDPLTKDVTCDFTLQYYALPGTWTCNVTVEDEDAATAYDTADVLVNDLIAIDVGTTIDFGTLAIGEYSSTVTFPVTNYGNVQLDLAANGTDFTCDQGTILANFTKAGDSADFSYGDGYSVQYTPDTDTSFDLDAKWNDSESTSEKDTYWQLLVPTGVKGVCTQTLQFTAVLSGYTNPGGPGGGLPL